MRLRVTWNMHNFSGVFKSLNIEAFQQVGACVFLHNKVIFCLLTSFCCVSIGFRVFFFFRFLVFFVCCKGQWTKVKHQVDLEENSNYVTNKSWCWKLLNFKIIYCTIFFWTMKNMKSILCRKSVLCAAHFFFATCSFIPLKFRNSVTIICFLCLAVEPMN